jgi:chromosome segregation ATPase
MKYIEDGQEAEIRKPEHMEQIRQLQNDLNEARSTIRLYMDQSEVLNKQTVEAQKRAKQCQDDMAPLQLEVR